METFINSNFDIELDLSGDIIELENIEKDLSIFKCIGSTGNYIGYDPNLDDPEVFMICGKWYYKIFGENSFSSFDDPHEAFNEAVEIYKEELYKKLSLAKKLIATVIIDVSNLLHNNNNFLELDITQHPNKKYIKNVKKKWKAKIGNINYLSDDTYENACNKFIEIAKENGENLIKIVSEFTEED